MATVVIKIAAVDYAPQIVFANAEFNAAVNGAVGTCRFRVRDEDRTLSFVTGSTIEFLVDGGPVWTGFITSVSRGYAFPAENVADAGLTRWLNITGSDLNVLFTRRIVYTVADPTDVFGKLYPPHTADSDVIADLVADYLDLSGDSLDTSSGVVNVGDINEDQDARAWSGGFTWGQAMGSIASLPAAVYFIDPTRVLDYVDVNTASAPFAMSDQPAPGEAGYREMTLTKDGTSLANDVLAWGMGYGSQVPVFVRDEDASSQALHGLWQAGVVKSGIYKQATINRVAASIVDGSPSSHRGAKDDRVAVEVVTYVPGFLPAQKVDFTSTIFGFSDVIPIRRMRVTFDAPDTPKYALTLSHAIDEPWGFFDQFLPKLPGSPKPPRPQLPSDCGITESFERVEVDKWGTCDAGIPWTVGNIADLPLFSVSSGEGVMLNHAAGTPEMNLNSVPFPTSWTLTTRFLVGSIPTDFLHEQLIKFQLGNGRTFEINLAVDSSHGYIEVDFEAATKQFINFAIGGYFIAKWYYDLTTGLSQAKCWHDGVDPEPDWQSVNDFYGPGDSPPTSLGLSHSSTPHDGSWDYEQRYSYLNITGVNRCSQTIIDNFERTVSNAWGTPTRGAPDWVDYSHSQSDSSTSQIGVSAIGPSTGWGRTILTITKPSSSPQRGAEHQMQLELPEITDWDEFKLGFDMVVNPAIGTTGIAFAQIRLGGAGDAPVSPQLDLPFQFEHNASPSTDHMDFFLARDGLASTDSAYWSDTHNETIANVSSFDGHITIDRSVSRGNTLVTVGVFGTFVFTPANPVGSGGSILPEDQLYVDYLDGSFDALTNVPSNFSIDNITLATPNSVDGSATAAAGTLYCERFSRVSSTVYRTTFPYTTLYMLLWRNGVLQRPGVDFDMTGTSTITFGTAVGTSEVVQGCYLPRAAS